MRLSRALQAAGLVSLTAIALASTATADVSMRNMVLEANLNEYPPAPGGTNYSACWSYIHSDGREYAVLGVGTGTAIYNVTDPASTYRVGFIAGPVSIWREMKSYRDWIYVVSEGTGAGKGLQIIRMTDPEHPVLAATYADSFQLAHTVSVDTSRALLICNGTRVYRGGSAYWASGMRILSIADPEAPVPLFHWPPIVPPVPDSLYVHDSMATGNRLYLSCVYVGTVRVLDTADPAAPVQIARWSYPGGFTHNTWPDATGNWLYVTDEVNGEPLKVFDISDLGAPLLFNDFTPNPHAIVHNAHARGNELYLANYTEGIRILDISDPSHPAEFAWADSWPALSGGYNGVWDVCAEFPSGTVIASDRTTGLYVYRPVRDYGLFRVQVRDGANQPLPGAHVFLDSGSDSTTTALDGVASFAPDPGTHAATAREFGFYDASALRVISSGGTQTVSLTLSQKPAADFTVTVLSAATQAPLEDAEVTLAYTPIHEHTDAAGQVDFTSLPADAYRLEVSRPGYIPVAFDRVVSPGASTQEIQLIPAALYDDLETATAWIDTGAPGDNATQGLWVRVDPVGTATLRAVPAPGGDGLAPALSLDREARARPLGAQHEGDQLLAPAQVQPEYDRTPAPGTLCYVTGQANVSNPQVGNNCVVGGRTSLTSPSLDATGMAEPTVGFWRWFYSSGDPTNHWFAVLISNDGTNWVPVDTTRGLFNEWQERTIRVADYVTPTSQVRVRFQAAAFGGSVVEAAVDDLTLYDAPLAALGLPSTPRPTRLAFLGPRPNPARGAVRLGLENPGRGPLEVEVLDLQGRRVATLFRGEPAPGTFSLEWSGGDDQGRPARPGLYWARARSGGEEAVVRLVRLP